MTDRPKRRLAAALQNGSTEIEIYFHLGYTAERFLGSNLSSAMSIERQSVRHA